MADILNLRLARKARDRQRAADAADARRAEFGRSGAGKRATATERARRDRALDGAKREE